MRRHPRGAQAAQPSPDVSAHAWWRGVPPQCFGGCARACVNGGAGLPGSDSQVARSCKCAYVACCGWLHLKPIGHMCLTAACNGRCSAGMWASSLPEAHVPPLPASPVHPQKTPPLHLGEASTPASALRLPSPMVPAAAAQDMKPTWQFCGNSLSWSLCGVSQAPSRVWGFSTDAPSLCAPCIAHYYANQAH